MRQSVSRAIGTLVAIAVLFMMPAVVRGDSLPTELTKAASVFSNILQDSSREISITTLVDKTPGNFGPGLQRELEIAFAQHQFIVKETAPMRLAGEIAIVDDEGDLGSPPANRMMVVQVRLELMRDSEKLHSHTVFLNRAADIARFGGLNVRFDTDGASSRAEHRLLRRAKCALETANGSAAPGGPPVGFVATGTRIQSDPRSPISVEIATASALSASSGGPIKTIPRAPDGKHSECPFVPIGQGELYEVIVHNESDHEIAVELTIDGLDQFTFSEDRDPVTGRAKFTHWLIAPHSSFTIPGWHYTSDPNRKDGIKRFLVTQYGGGASQYVSHPDKTKVGVLTLSFSRCHQPGSPSRSAGSETGFGPDLQLKQKPVQRAIDPPHEFISIRYAK